MQVQMRKFSHGTTILAAGGPRISRNERLKSGSIEEKPLATEAMQRRQRTGTHAPFSVITRVQVPSVTPTESITCTEISHEIGQKYT
jgi:hypothetical protein